MTTHKNDTASSSDVVDLATGRVGELMRTHYGIDATGVRTLGAESSAVCRVDRADGSSVAVKIFWADAEPSALVRWQHEVVAHLADAGHPVARPIRGTGGELTVEGIVDGRPVLLQASEWLTGPPLEEARISPVLLREIGRTAARLQVDLSRETVPGGFALHPWEISRSRATIEAATIQVVRMGSVQNANIPDTESAARLGALATRVCSALRTVVEPRLDQLPRALTHHDLHDSNLLVGPSRDPRAVVGILDFGDMLESIRIAEPVIAAAYAARNCPDPLAAVHEVLDGWEETVPITAAEASVALPLAAARLTANAAVWTSRLGTTRGAYAAARLHGSLDTAEQLMHQL